MLAVSFLSSKHCPYKFIGTLHTDESRLFPRTCSFDQFGHCNASKQRCRNPGSTPREPFTFSNLVLFFSPVPSADECYRAGDLFIFGDELTKCKGEWSLDKATKTVLDICYRAKTRILPFHRELPIWYVWVLNVGHSAMISNVEELGTSQEAFIEKRSQGCLDIEWVNARQTYQSRVPWNVGIWSFLVDIENLSGLTGRRRERDLNLIAGLGVVLFSLSW